MTKRTPKSGDFAQRARAVVEEATAEKNWSAPPLSVDEDEPVDLSPDYTAEELEELERWAKTPTEKAPDSAPS